MRDLPPIHPGEQLREEFMKPFGITAYRLAKDVGVPVTRIQAIRRRAARNHWGHRFAPCEVFQHLTRVLAQYAA